MALIGRLIGNRQKFDDCFSEDLNEGNDFWQSRCAGLALLLPKHERNNCDKNGYFFCASVKIHGEERAVFFELV